MSEYEDNLKKAKEQLEIAQTNLLETYLSRIKETYLNLESKQKGAVLNGLDSLVTSIENKTLKYFSPKREHIGTNSNFDGKKAREIRTQAGLTYEELVKNLELKVYARGVINSFEVGRTKPRNPPRTNLAKKYINWLKENGYNPYNL